MKRAWIVLGLTVALAGPAGAALPAPSTSTLPNGLRVVLAPDPSAVTIHVTMCYGLAPLMTPARPASEAALLGDLLAAEPAQDPALSRVLIAWGAAMTHAVRPDAMYFETTAAPAALDSVLALEAARMRPFEVTQDRLDALRSTRTRQWQAAETDPVTRGVVALTRAAYRGHAYGRLVESPETDETAITPATMAAARDACVQAGNAVLVIAGRFDANEALRLIRRWFGNLPRHAVARGQLGSLPAEGEVRTIPMTAALGQIMFVGWRGGGASDRDTPALEVLAEVIGGGGASLLGRDVDMVKGVYGHVESHFDANRDASVLSCTLLPRPDADRKGTQDDVVGKIEALATQPLSDQDLARAKRQAEAQRVFALRTPADRGEALATTMITTGRADEKGPIEAIRKLTAADVQRAAAKVLVASRRSVVWVVPASDTTGTETGP